MLMQITLTKEQVKEVFGELRYMGADYCYRYDKDTRKKTEDIEAVKLHLGSMKLGNSVDIRLEMTEIPTIEPYSVMELDTPVYAPYVQRGNYPTLVERVTCKGIRCISQKKCIVTYELPVSCCPYQTDSKRDRDSGSATIGKGGLLFGRKK